ncbi:hypothetical protein [Cupriavidus consociatus]|uniref:hypothetical protein n=1 Tax=Cupriavidus consociatus TaxID=2821357 RepID=UPI001AE29369|nr:MULTISPECIES: hypothetical protein [unclassified Cupriavidus]MBP0622927.1 hypothetical protein [Cupriavidus sp. LEh25]MDK2659615.1 hypothetical protein [Cupriavidus sp. LEh21]
MSNEDDRIRIARPQCSSDLTATALERCEAILVATEEAFNVAPMITGEQRGCRKPAAGVVGFRVERFPSKKNARDGVNIYFSCESSLESAFALELERNRSFQAFVSQALAVPLPDGTKQIVDFIALDWEGIPHYREVKVSPSKTSHRAMEKVMTAQRVMRGWGLDYQIVYADELPCGLPLSNLRYLYSQYTCVPTAVTQELILERLRAYLPSTYGALRQQFGEEVAFLMFVGLLEVDLSKPVNYETVLTRCATTAHGHR